MDRNKGYSKKELVSLLRGSMSKNNKVLVKALLKVYEKQTRDEKEAEVTTESNGVGFNKADSGILGNISKYYIHKGYLSAGQLQVVSKRMIKYAGQLIDLAIQNGVYKKVGGKYYIVETQKR